MADDSSNKTTFLPFPQNDGQWDAWLAELRKESDRAAGVLAGGWLDAQLAALLKHHFVDDPKLEAALLKPDRPLGSFASKIHLAFALGFLTPDVYSDLHLIRKIRNEFAHTVTGDVSFESPPISQRCAQLRLPNFVMAPGEKPLGPLSPRGAFTISACVIAQHLFVATLKVRHVRCQVAEALDWPFLLTHAEIFPDGEPADD